MSESPERPFITWRRLILIFGVWTLVAVMSTQTASFAFTRTGRSFDWKPNFFSNLSSCMLWAVFTPFLLALGRRFRIERGVWPMHLALHLAVGVAFTAVDVFSWTLEAPYIRLFSCKEQEINRSPTSLDPRRSSRTGPSTGTRCTSHAAAAAIT